MNEELALRIGAGAMVGLMEFLRATGQAQPDADRALEIASRCSPMILKMIEDHPEATGGELLQKAIAIAVGVAARLNQPTNEMVN